MSETKEFMMKIENVAIERRKGDIHFTIVLEEPSDDSHTRIMEIQPSELVYLHDILSIVKMLDDLKPEKVHLDLDAASITQ